MDIAYLAQGKIRLKAGAQPPRTIESQYGETLRDRINRSQQRHSWKGQGADNGFFSGQSLWGKRANDPAAIRIAVTSICRGSARGQVLYSLESDSLCGVLALDNLGAEERRLWNNNTIRLRHLSSSSDTGDLACSVEHEFGTANIGIMLNDDSGLKEVTEGDSFDTAPRWLPGPGKQIVFQSAGVGRDRDGNFAGHGPFSIQQLNLDSGEMATLAEDAQNDLLSPHVARDGALYFIRRPYRAGPEIKPLHMLKDVILFPFRLIYAVFQFFNVFTQMFTGNKLTTAAAGGVKKHQADPLQMMIWGNLVNAEKAAEGKGDAPDLVPKSWQLVRRRPGAGEEIIARGVLAFDLCADGAIVYSNGSAIFSLLPDGNTERLLVDKLIEQVAVLETAAPTA